MATRIVKPGTFNSDAALKPQYIKSDIQTEKPKPRQFGIPFNPADGKYRNYRVEQVSYGWVKMYKVVYDDISDYDGSKVIRVTSKRAFETEKAAQAKLRKFMRIQEKAING